MDTSSPSRLRHPLTSEDLGRLAREVFAALLDAHGEADVTIGDRCVLVRQRAPATESRGWLIVRVLSDLGMRCSPPRGDLVLVRGWWGRS